MDVLLPIDGDLGSQGIHVGAAVTGHHVGSYEDLFGQGLPGPIEGLGPVTGPLPNDV